MAGAGVGLSIGPLAVHARFSQPSERLAVVSCLSLFVRSSYHHIHPNMCVHMLSSPVHWAAQSVSPSAVPFSTRK